MDVIINANQADKIAASTSINFYLNVLACMGYKKDAPPLADLLCHYHGLSGQWLIASPVYWEATHNDAMIVAAGDELQLSETEARQWFTALAEFVAVDGINLHYHDAHTWLLQRNDKPPVNTKPTSLILKQSIMPALNSMGNALIWQRFLTENQMFFSSHPLNQTRASNWPINGLWLWGDGALKLPGDRPLVSDDSFFNTLAPLLSSHISRYHPTQPLSKKALLVINAIELIDLKQLEKQLQKQPVCWYWNNTVYNRKPKRWWSLTNRDY